MPAKKVVKTDNDVFAEPVTDGVAGEEVAAVKNQPMSLEDALAASEQAATELVEVETAAPKRKKSGKKLVAEEESLTVDFAAADDLGAAVYNPDLILSDVSNEASDDSSPAAVAADMGVAAAPSFEDAITLEGKVPDDTAIVANDVAVASADVTALDAEAMTEFPVLQEIAAEEIAEEHVVHEVAAEMESVEETEVAPLNIPKIEIPAEDIPTAPAQVAMDDAPAAVAEVSEPVAEVPAEEVKPVKKTPAKKGTSKAKKTAEETPVEVAVQPSPEVVEEAPAPVVAEEPKAEEKADDKDKKKKSKDKKKSKEEDAPVEKSEEAIAADEAKKEEKAKKLKKKLDPEKNFKLLKSLIVILSLLVTGISAYIFYFYIYDSTTAFSWIKLIPIIPFLCQVLLVLISFVALGTSKRKPIGSAIKENKQIKQEVKVKEKEAAVIKEIEDNLLVPEIDLSKRKVAELSSYQIDNFYKKNIEEINGKYYMQVAKFDENVRAFESMGATDMELCAVNMVCNSKFDEILDQPRTKTLNSRELVSYFLSKPNTFAIKKRGAIDWTFKYSSKSFGIIRENEDSYKVSIKCYPDAATKLNDAYKALEDSNFPSGPLWYCFNELRNLPPRVCKWLIDTSCQISKFQQIKTDKLKDEKNPGDYDLDMNAIVAALKNGQKYISFPKFTVVFSKGDDADLTTYLTRECEGLNADAFTKEYYYKCTVTDDALSVLCPSKGVQEEAVIMMFDRIDEYLK